jgi:hypothetical protein
MGIGRLIEGGPQGRLGVRLKEGRMTSLHPEGSERPDEISGTFLSLITISFLELRQDIARLMESNWSEPVRRRAHELATTLEEACGRQGLSELSGLARSIASLVRLSRAEAGPLLMALREKFEELMALANRLLARYSNRQTG